MSIAKRIFHFLGGIFFALILIGLSTLFVMGGTFIESLTKSHLHASYFTYSNPFFKGLLFLFFINILFAALRRWPFSTKHIPFLITHLGLLMILAGCIVKSYMGVQGVMSLAEGSASDTLFIPSTYALRIEDQQNNVFLSNIQSNMLGKIEKNLETPFKGLKLEILEISAHAQVHLDSWTQDNHLIIASLPPLPIHDTKLNRIKNCLENELKRPTELIACKSPDPYAVAKKIFIEKSILKLPNEDIASLAELLATNSSIPTTLSFDANHSNILLSINDQQVQIELAGNKPLVNSANIDILLPQTLIFVKDADQEHFFLFNEHGALYHEVLNNTSLPQIFSFNKGFSGYGACFFPPSYFFDLSRDAVEAAYLHPIQLELNELFSSTSLQEPVLLAFKEACIQCSVDPSNALLGMLNDWQKIGSWLYPRTAKLSESFQLAMETFDPNKLETHAGALWTSLFFSKIATPSPIPYKKLLRELQEKKVKLIDTFLSHLSYEEKQDPHKVFSAITRAFFRMGQTYLPPDDLYPNAFSNTLTTQDKAHLFSAHLRNMGLYLDGIDLERGNQLHSDDSKILEEYFNEQTPGISKKRPCLISPISQRIVTLPPLKKWEDNQAKITLRASESNGNAPTVISLLYDPSASSFKWPILNGKYLLRFQPLAIKIPYRVRLRCARQINYPGSLQPFSFESDLIISAKKSIVLPVEKTISMNNIHETYEGYRFYMSNIAQAKPLAAKRAQITVNYDPGKRYLTYPGAALLSLGIILLFWLKPYKKKVTHV